MRANAVYKMNLAEKLDRFAESWSPRIVGELNGQHVKLAKLQGEFVWHKHDHEDELFPVVHGHFRMDFRDRQVSQEEKEFLVVPRGVEHRPAADVEAHIPHFGPAGTPEAGEARDDLIVQALRLRPWSFPPASGPLSGPCRGPHTGTRASRRA